MLSTAIAAWRNLVKRLTVDWLILTAGTVTILLAMVLLAAGPIYADAVTESSLRRTLSEAPVIETTTVLEVRTAPGQYPTVDQIATAAIADAFSGADATVTRLVDAETLELPDRIDDTHVDLAQLRWMEGIENHASLLEGSWPKSRPETAVNSTVAEQLSLRVGDTLTLTDPRDRTRHVEVELVGIYRPLDNTDPYWLEEELTLAGMVESGGFRTFGPFLVEQTGLDEITPRAMASWRVQPDFETLEVVEAAPLRGRVTALPRTLTERLAPIEEAGHPVSEFSVETGLDRLLSGTGRSLTVTRSSVLALLIQLAVLAGYALTLTAGLLVGSRSTETYLLRARGASPRQMLAAAGFEGVLLTVPVALIAPWLAAWTLEALATFGPLAPIALEVTPAVTAESRVIVYIAAALSVLALAWPAWRSARSMSGTTRRRTRQRSRSGAQRAGVDLALLGLAVLAFWQLQILGPQVSSTIQGRFGVDPVLIAAPTLGLLAGSVLALRIVPLLARVGESVASAGRGSVAALTAWQVARRPSRYARSALLLIMAVAIGFFATSYSGTWLESQRDQADFEVGADLRVVPNRRTSDSITDLHLVSAYESVGGLARSMPVARMTGALPGSDLLGEFVFVDSAVAADVVELRDDLSPGFDRLMKDLASARRPLSGIDLPGEPERVGVVIDASEEEIEDEEHGVFPALFEGEVRLILADGRGLLHRVAVGEVVVNQGTQTLVADLTADLDDEGTTSPVYPLRVVAIEIASPPTFSSRDVTIDLIDLVTAQSLEGTLQPLGMGTSPVSWTPQAIAIGQVFESPRITVPTEQPGNALRAEIETGQGFQGITMYAFRPPSSLPDTFPVVATTSWLEAGNRQVGEVTDLDVLGTGTTRAVVIGAVEAFPTIRPGEREAVIVDLPTYQAIRYSPGLPIAQIDEYWMAVDGDADLVASALREPALDAYRVEGRTDRFLGLSTDPVALGTIGALSIGFIAAAVFAAVGFAVSATVSARERITEFGLLRALGLSPRQLGLWITLEQGVLVVSSLVFGTLVGWALTATILPLVTVTQQGTRPVPDVAIVYPWDAVLLLELALVAVLGVIVLVMSLLLRRLGLGSLLRLGED